jgi:hypothetical protein
MKNIETIEDVKNLDIIAEFKRAKKIYLDTVEEVCGSLTAYSNLEQSHKIDKKLKKYDKKFYINERQYIEFSIVDASYTEYGIGALFVGFGDDTGENFNRYPSESYEITYSLSEVSYYWNNFLKCVKENNFIEK